MTLCDYTILCDYMATWLYYNYNYVMPRPKQVLCTGSISASFVLMTSKFGKKETNLSSRAHR